MKKVYIETMGCQMNKSDTERMLGMLSHFGYEEVEDPKLADLLMVNTCSIRQLSEDKAYSLIGSWGKWKKESNPSLKIGFCGCVAQQKAEKIFKRAPYVDFVLGTHNIYKLPEIVKAVENGEKVCECTETHKTEDTRGFSIKRVKSVNAWINITEGCNNFCTYCIVPYTRGRERSRLPEVIIKEAKDALAEGHKEITLLGQNVDSYGKDFKDKNYRLADLLRDLNALEGNFRIRFVTSYPTDITDELIKTVVELDKVCEYFHIPMQSGSSEVLKKMNRRYDRETYAKIVKKVRDLVPDVTITSDFIAGFPGETEEQFEELARFVKEKRFDRLGCFAYSAEEDTAAAQFAGQIDEQTKQDRTDNIMELQMTVAGQKNAEKAGTVTEVLIEGWDDYIKCYFGRTPADAPEVDGKIFFMSHRPLKIGDFVRVRVNDCIDYDLLGELYE